MAIKYVLYFNTQDNNVSKYTSKLIIVTNWASLMLAQPRSQTFVMKRIVITILDGLTSVEFVDGLQTDWIDCTLEMVKLRQILELVLYQIPVFDNFIV